MPTYSASIIDVKSGRAVASTMCDAENLSQAVNIVRSPYSPLTAAHPAQFKADGMVNEGSGIALFESVDSLFALIVTQYLNVA